MLSAILLVFALSPVEEIMAGARYVHVPLGRYELTETLAIPSGVTIVCEPGATFEAAPGAFLGVHEPLVLMENTTNAAVYNCTFKGRKMDYVRPPYEASEWRHAIEMRGATSIYLSGITVASSGGDGILIGASITCPHSECRKPSQDITIDRLTATDNHRNGVSITCAVNVTIRDSLIELTKGTAPQAGIDIEPDHGGDRIENIKVERVTARGNAGSAFMVNMDRQNAASKPISITFTDCAGTGIPNGHWLIKVVEYGSNQLAQKPKGQIRFNGDSVWANPVQSTP